ncbi:hypothetical protein ABZY57_20560 [Streptomyces sp. NPDC006450]|uniref:hypothetical protein n=1 Tax=Streptomyces sp. NPDC006450 TaxID=3155458 RepID=UPI0033A7FC2C
MNSLRLVALGDIVVAGASVGFASQRVTGVVKAAMAKPVLMSWRRERSTVLQ